MNGRERSGVGPSVRRRCAAFHAFSILSDLFV